MEQIHAFEKENQISFSDRKSLIQFVSKYIAFLYKRHCEFWRATAMDDRGEMISWEERIQREGPALEKVVKDLMNTKRYFRREMKFTSKSHFLKEAFKKAKISSSPLNCIPCNVEYKIDGLVFSRDVSDRPI